MKPVFIACTAMVFYCLGSCTHEPNKQRGHLTSTAVAEKIDYASRRNNISKLKTKSRSRWNGLDLSQRSKIFCAAVTDSIIPGWIGTDWSFNGCTQKPGSGSVACGYFVTTVLQDAGLPIARIKLAQCPSEEMIKTLVAPNLIQRFSNKPMEIFISNIKEQGTGLFIIGLDCHTGFIYNDGKEVFFIHASYVGERKVIKEIAADSYVLKSSKYKVTGKISADERALNKWMDN